uniref:Uncharacterized protein n=1 Tax=Ciona intestinalis TaxID=7719 RepID=H2XKZ1_CIOIN
MKWLVLLAVIQVVINKREAGCLSASELSLEPKSDDNIRSGLVHLRELLTDRSFAHSCFSWMQDIHKHLLPL